MSAALWIGVALLGGAGAVARVLVTRRFRDAARGTLAINLAGAATLGLLVGAGLRGDALLLVGGGLLGTLTTFSTWMAETRERGSWTLALGALILGLGAAAAGRMIGAAV